MSGKQMNWSGNVTFRAATIHRPTSVEAVQELVSRSEKVRALGSAHSFNDIADTPEVLLSLDALPDVFTVDETARTVTVRPGTRYAELGRRLHERGLALANLASLPHISVAGSVATGTHGSGDSNGGLATAVAGIELVTGGGELVRLDRAHADFDGAVVALGALGVVTAVTLDVLPTYDVRQYLFFDLPLAAVDAHLDEVFSCAYSVSLFSRWREPAFELVWVKRHAGQAGTPPCGESWFTARAADRPVPGLNGAPCTEQLGVPGPWHERLPHFRPEFTPSSGVELQTEFLVPRGQAVEALHAVDGVRDRVAPVLQVSEIRTVAADDLWLSPAYGRPTVAIHFTWVRDPAAVLPVIELLEERLAPYDARPHWGKLFTAAPADRYPRMADFRALMRGYDPDGTFTNGYIERFVAG